MKLEQQLTPFPQARRLDELGFKGESHYRYMQFSYWEFEDIEDVPFEWKYCISESTYVNSVCDWTDDFAAYSVPELMDALPAWTEVYKIPKTYDGNQYNVVSDDYEDAQWLAPELAEALSKYIICLIEQGLYIVNKE